MANISLRAYYREIEELIGHGRIDEVISHCRHILKFYPKDVSIYRLLAKAYLESQRFSDATDIFQRVLSVIPDDFVAHVGMSIIREDEGNMDAAIWHMERAFEVQPSNSAIRDELRRLFGRRDGMEPPKIRLTRGALARMYSQGNLYQQSIGELRAALSKDPQRFDLQVLLARMYFLNNQRVEAAETCNTLLNKLPFCLDANRILAEILHQSGRADEADVYHQRAQVLDPYSAHVTPNQPATDTVPDNAVTLVRLDWQPGQQIGETTQQPDWATSLGISLEEDADREEELPDWLIPEDEVDRMDTEDLMAEFSPSPEVEVPTILETPKEEPEPIMSEPQDTSPEPKDTSPEPQEEPQDDISPEEASPQSADDLVPEWMKDAGWATAESLTGEEPVSPEIFDTLDLPTGDEEIVEGEIPDWLQEIAPKEVVESAESEAPEAPEAAMEDEEMSGEIPSWLSSRPPGPTDSVVMWLENKTDDEGEPLPKTGPIESETPEGTEEDIPDWLKSVARDIEQPEGVELEPATTEEIPVPTEMRTDEIPTDEVPLEEAPTDEVPFPEAAAEAAVPDWMSAPSPEVEEESIEDTRPRRVTGDLPPADETVIEIPAEVVEFPTEEPLYSVADEEPPTSIEPSPEEEMPDWLAEMEAATPFQEADEQVAAEAPTTEEEVPDWLKEMGAQVPETPEVPAEAVASEFAEDEEIPAWLREPEAVGPAPVEEIPETAAEVSLEDEELEFAEAGEETFLPSMEDQDAAIAWLESLAAKKGVAEEELITSPEDRLETPPEWVTDSMTGEEELAPEAFESVKPELPDQPDWMTETLIGDTFFPEAEVGEAEAEEIGEPAWAEDTLESTGEPKEWSLDTLEPEAEAEIPEIISEEPVEEPAVTDEWMLETDLPEVTLEEEVGAEVEAPVPTVMEDTSEVADWLETLEPEEEVETADVADWLDTLEPDTEVEIPEELEVAASTVETPTLEESDWELETAIPEGVEPSDEPVDEFAPPEVTFEAAVEEAPETVLETPSLEVVEEELDAEPEWMLETALPEEFEEILAEEPTPEEKELVIPDVIERETIPQPAETRQLDPDWLSEEELEEAEVEEVAEVSIPEMEAAEVEEAAEVSIPEMEAAEPEVAPEWMLETALPEEMVEEQPLPEAVEVEEVTEPFAEEPLPELVEVEEVTEPITEEPVAVEVAIPPKPDTGLLYDEMLTTAKGALTEGQVSEALSSYTRLIRRRRHLDVVIEDLQEAVYRHPMDTQILETLGDAFVKATRLQDALDTYTKAEDLLRQ